MAAVRFLSRHPAVVLAVLVTGFGTWVAADLTGPSGRRPTTDPPEWNPVLTDPARQQLMGRALLAVRVGMPRLKVEELLGPPMPEDLRPVDLTGRSPVYQASYRAVLPGPHPDCPGVSGPCQVVLAFDAGRPGHPLTRITCTPLDPPLPFASAV
jgi:hypothetical protein